MGEHLFNVYDNIVKNYSVETEDAIDENLDEDLVQSSEKKNFKYYFSKVILFMGQAMTPFITVVYGAGTNLYQLYDCKRIVAVWQRCDAILA